MTIVQCYSGWRPGEVITLAVNNIDLENRTYTGGVKTSNGINRTVPILPKVLPIIHKYYHEAIDIGRPMLFGRTQKFHGSYRYIENSFRNWVYTHLNIEWFRTEIEKIL